MPHDYDAQYLNTVDTFEGLMSRIPALPDVVRLDLWFVSDPRAPLAPDAPRLAAALAAAGFEVTWIDDGLEATIPVRGIDADRIWHEERRATDAALACGHRPDGWGFAIPPRSPIGGLLGRLLGRATTSRPASPTR